MQLALYNCCLNEELDEEPQRARMRLLPEHVPLAAQLQTSPVIWRVVVPRGL